MSAFSPLTEREFTPPIQLERVLSAVQIEYLDVDDQRLYVIFADSVLEVRVRSGTREATQTLSVAVVEGPDRSDVEPESIVADFLDLLEDTATADQ